MMAMKLSHFCKIVDIYISNVNSDEIASLITTDPLSNSAHNQIIESFDEAVFDWLIRKENQLACRTKGRKHTKFSILF